MCYLHVKKFLTGKTGKKYFCPNLRWSAQRVCFVIFNDVSLFYCKVCDTFHGIVETTTFVYQVLPFGSIEGLNEQKLLTCMLSLNFFLAWLSVGQIVTVRISFYCYSEKHDTVSLDGGSREFLERKINKTHEQLKVY